VLLGLEMDAIFSSETFAISSLRERIHVKCEISTNVSGKIIVFRAVTSCSLVDTVLVNLRTLRRNRKHPRAV
jgi:hypothetical protein